MAIQRNRRQPAVRTSDAAIVECLASHRLFGVLRRPVLNDLAPEVIERIYPKGHYLFQIGDAPGYIFLLKSGVVTLAEPDRHGHAHPIVTFSTGAVFGLATAVLGIRRRTSASALIDANALLIPREIFDDLCGHHPELAHQVTRELCWLMCRVEEAVFRFTFGTVTARIARLLLDRAVSENKENKTSFSLALSHQDLALLVGTNRETVTRALGRMSRSGVISAHHHCVRILDHAKLRHLASG